MLSKLSFYATSSHPCSYLEGNTAKTAFADPNIKLTPSLYSSLIQYGFRRSGSHIYRPHCDNCSACTSIRVKTAYFLPGKRFKRVLKNNSDLQCKVIESIDTPEHYKLYRKYISSRHKDGEMDEDNYSAYRDFLCSSWADIIYLEVRINNELIAIAVTDQVEDGISAVYTFFDPDELKRSLGTYLILKQIELNNSLGNKYLYLGYWIKNCRKMSYKTDFKPFQLFIDGEWQNDNLDNS